MNTYHLLRDDGKRQDGVSLIPWSQGKADWWEVTVVVCLAASCVDISETRFA